MICILQGLVLEARIPKILYTSKAFASEMKTTFFLIFGGIISPLRQWTLTVYFEWKIGYMDKRNY